MKAIVLCAGEAKRLRPISFTGPKHLIPIANKPILIHIIEDVARAGIHDVGIITNRRWESVFRDALAGAEARWGVAIDYIYQDEPLGLAHAASMARDFVGDQPFLMCLGDNMFERGLVPIVARYKESGADAVVSLYEVGDPSAFGVAELEDHRIRCVVEKPKDPKSNWAVVGVYLFESSVFDAIDTLEPSARGEYEITDAIQALIDRNLTVAPHFVEGWWMDTGTADDMIQANRRLLLQIAHNRTTDVGTMIWDELNPDRLPEGTVIENSEIRGPVMIGKGCHIESAYVGPFTSIGNNVTIVCSEVENSILLDDCQIRDFGPRLDKSIIGSRARLTTSSAMPLGSASMFILADDSVVDLQR